MVKTWLKILSMICLQMFAMNYQRYEENIRQQCATFKTIYRSIQGVTQCVNGPDFKITPNSEDVYTRDTQFLHSC